MLNMSMKTDFQGLQKTLEILEKDLATKQARIALTRTVTKARRDVMKVLPKVFDEPTPFTVNSIRYEMATKEQPEAKVYVSDDAAKGLSPRKYLLAEIQGGERNLKRSERALIAAGLMLSSQRIVPGKGIALDRFGNIPGPLMVQILSRLSALGEQGYKANVSKRTKKKIKDAGLATRRTGTDYFVAKSRRTGRPLGIYQLVGRGQVRPVIIFAGRLPSYKNRFDFHGIVDRSAQENWPKEMDRAMKDMLKSVGSEGRKQ